MERWESKGIKFIKIRKFAAKLKVLEYSKI